MPENKDPTITTHTHTHTKNQANKQCTRDGCSSAVADTIKPKCQIRGHLSVKCMMQNTAANQTCLAVPEVLMNLGFACWLVFGFIQSVSCSENGW